MPPLRAFYLELGLFLGCTFLQSDIDFFALFFFDEKSLVVEICFIGKKKKLSNQDMIPSKTLMLIVDAKYPNWVFVEEEYCC